MNVWENAVITTQGLSLLAKLTAGNKLEITRGETGAGYVTPGTLAQQTTVSNPMQSLKFSAISYPEEGKCKLPCRLTNDDVATGYTATQVGVYATDPDEGEILFLLVQAASGEGTIVPSAAEMPGYSAEWSLYLQYGQANGVNVSVDPSNSVTREDLDAGLQSLIKDVYLDMGEAEYNDIKEPGIYRINYIDDEDGRPMDVIQYLIVNDNTDGRYPTQQTWFGSSGNVLRREWDYANNRWTSWQSYATSGDVKKAVADLVESAPETLNTLDELAAALGDDPNFATTIIGMLGNKAEKEHSHSLDEITETANARTVRVVNLTSTDGANYTGTTAEGWKKEGTVFVFIPNMANTGFVNIVLNNGFDTPLYYHDRQGEHQGVRANTFIKNSPIIVVYDYYANHFLVDNVRAINPLHIESETYKFNRVLAATSADGRKYDLTLDDINVAQLYAGYELTIIPSITSSHNKPYLYIVGRNGIVSSGDLGIRCYPASSNVNTDLPIGILQAGKPTKLMWDGQYWIIIDSTPAYTYGTEDLEAGVTELATGQIHYVYE